MIVEPVARCGDDGLSTLAALIYGTKQAAAQTLVEQMCNGCFGTGKRQEQDRYGKFTPYVTTCLCCGGSGRVVFQEAP